MEELLVFYSAYIETLKRSPFPHIFLQLAEAVIDIPSHRVWEQSANKDMFLERFKKDKIGLAEDINEHGVYFPLWGYYAEDRVNVIEGMHRIESIHMYIDKCGSWQYPLMTFIVPETFYDKDNYADYRESIYFPVFNIENNWHREYFGHHFTGKNRDTYDVIERDCPVIFVTKNVQQYINAVFIWHKFLRHAISKYQAAAGKRFPVSGFINSNRNGLKNAI